MGAEHEHGQGAALLPQFTQQVQATAVRQAHIQHQQVEAVGAQQAAGIAQQQAVAHGQAVAFQGVGHGARDGRVVLHEQQAGRHGQRATSTGKSLPSPSAITSTARAARIRPMSRVITLMPVLPSTRAIGSASAKHTAVAKAMTTP